MTDVSYFAPGPSTLPSPSEAREALAKMVAVIVKTKGYDDIQSSAMGYILNNLESLLISLPTHAHELAIMANRRVPSTRDVYLALQQSGPRLRPAELEQHLQSVNADSIIWTVETDVTDGRPPWFDPLEGCLPSESEDDSAKEDSSKEVATSTTTRSKAAAEAPARKRRRKKFRPEMAEVPSHLPSLPPKHTWLSTPSYPAHAMTMQPPLAFLDLKVSSNRLMESSLRGLIRATDAAVLDSQAQRGAFAIEKDIEAGTSDLGTFSGTAEDRQDMSLQSLAPGEAGSDPLGGAGEQEMNRAQVKKGRTLSLRLRTPSMSLPGACLSSPVDNAATAQRTTSHRQSLSISGPQSALVSSFSSHFRYDTASAGPWSANSTQTPLSWNSTMQTGDSNTSPLATPLTAGMGYHYPPTPSQVYTSEVLSLNGAMQASEQEASGPIGLPPIVNYKRTWYKKNNSASIQSRIKS